MTMRFRAVKDWIVDYLAANATAGKFRVLGYRDDAVAASTLVNPDRLVQVFAKSGDFPRNASGYTGPVSHDVSLEIALLTACTSTVDLSVLGSETSTPAQIAAAMMASEKATKRADDDSDEFVDTVFQLLMAADQQEFGLPGHVANRWAASWKKGAPIMRGSTVVIPASLEFSFRVDEDLTGEIPKTPTADELVSAAILVTTDEDADPVGGAAVTVGGAAS